MEKIKAEFSKELYDILPPLMKVAMTVIEVSNDDYKEDEEWVRLKEVSNAAYKALKKREFKLREYLKQ
jgi:hypothetical protein